MIRLRSRYSLAFHRLVCRPQTGAARWRHDPTIHEWFIQWTSLHAWLIHFGGAGVGGLSPRSFRSIEVLCREKVKALVPEAYRLVAVEMHMQRALPNFFEERDRVKNKVETYAAIDARLQTLGRPSKLADEGNA
jgi:hypothetical protein